MWFAASVKVNAYRIHYVFEMNLDPPPRLFKPPASLTVTLLPSYSIRLHYQGQHPKSKSLGQLEAYQLTLLNALDFFA